MALGRAFESANTVITCSRPGSPCVGGYRVGRSPPVAKMLPWGTSNIKKNRLKVSTRSHSAHSGVSCDAGLIMYCASEAAAASYCASCHLQRAAASSGERIAPVSHRASTALHPFTKRLSKRPIGTGKSSIDYIVDCHLLKALESQRDCHQGVKEPCHPRLSY